MLSREVTEPPPKILLVESLRETNSSFVVFGTNSSESGKNIGGIIFDFLVGDVGLLVGAGGVFGGVEDLLLSSCFSTCFGGDLGGRMFFVRSNDVLTGSLVCSSLLISLIVVLLAGCSLFALFAKIEFDLLNTNSFNLKVSSSLLYPSELLVSNLSGLEISLSVPLLVAVKSP